MAQGALPPHVHCPPALQLSVSTGSHAAQVAPGGAQWPASRGEKHAPALQQPEGHEVASQTHMAAAPVPTQRCPAAHALPVFPHTHAPELHALAVEGHAAHVTPANPQADVVFEVHTLPAQHPLAQVVASQTQTPPLQS